MEVLVTIQNPKYASGDDSGWYSEGHDACRAEQTSASTNMEWCVRDKSKVQYPALQGWRGRRENADEGPGRTATTPSNRAVSPSQPQFA